MSRRRAGNRAATVVSDLSDELPAFRKEISHACIKRSHVLSTDDLHCVAIAMDDISALEKEAQTPSGQRPGGSRSKPTITKSSARCGDLIAPLVIVTHPPGRIARRVRQLKFQGETECAEHRTGETDHGGLLLVPATAGASTTGSGGCRVIVSR